jgi:hypothetical protein
MSSQEASRNELSAASLDDSWALSHWEEAEEQQAAAEEDDRVVRQEASELQQLFRFDSSSSLPSFLPPQLHPAVSLGMRRVSSCCLSMHSTNSEGNTSVQDLLSLWDEAAATAVPTKSTGAIDSKDETASVCKDDTDQGSATDAVPRTYFSNTDDNNKKDWNTTSCDVLYHDILMHVFTFLDAKDLAAFSETARRPNFESFYFLQLQLQRALLCDSDGNSNSSATGSATGGTSTPLATTVPAAMDNRNRKHVGHNIDQDPLSAIAGVGSISRLAVLDRREAEQTVEAFLDSNGTLRTMPLSHSLAYIRQVLRLGRHHGLFFSDHDHNHHHMHQQAAPQQAALASAALVITFVSAASFMSGDSASVMSEMASFGTELPNMLFKVGFVGSLMGAATRTMQHQHQHSQSSYPASSSTTTTTNNNNKPEQGLRERAEQMARHMPELFKHIREQMRASSISAGGVDGQSGHDNDHRQGFASLSRMMHNAYDATYGEHHTSSDTVTKTTNCGQPDASFEKLTTPNPYEHLPDAITGVAVNTTYTTTGNCAQEQQRQHAKDDDSNKVESSCLDSEQDAKEKNCQKMPSGCVGAYSRAVARANARITDMVKARRKACFLELSELEQQQVASDLIDACLSDESFSVVRDFVQVRGSVDVEGFYVGSDGTETCALHAAAFHGSCRTLELLCSGIDESDSTQDGGLCDVNMKDSNGWTAMHFAAGANLVEAVRVLAKHGADLSIEAANGYTPLQWAVRLQNEKVAEELRNLMGTDRQLGWISRQPLSAIANRFFALIPSN